MVVFLKNKKGQVTLFVILGIVIVVVALLVLHTRTNLFLFNPSVEDLNNQLEGINEHVVDCILEVGEEPIRRIGLQGGYLGASTGAYIVYNDSTINYLCFNIEDSPQCMNRMLLEKNMEEQLSENIEFMLGSCLDVKSFKKFGGFEIVSGDWDCDVEIKKDNVVVNVYYPVQLKSTKSDVEVSMSDFYKSFDFPLGYLYDASQIIVNTEAMYGEFDQLIYMLQEKGKIRIEKKRPYPDKLYIMNAIDNDYVFQFAIQGEVT